MPSRARRGRKLSTTFLPVALVATAALVGLMGWLVAGATRPPRQPYLVTPEKFAQLSARGLRATEQTWVNPDGTTARGWLLRGDVGAPAILLLHRFGADRSWVLNLGVKVNESTNTTVLLPDLRGHGENPPVASTGFGAEEGDDTLAAIQFLRSLRASQGGPLVGERIGLYGVGVGAYAALAAASRDHTVRVLVLDSVPASPDDVLRDAVGGAAGFDNQLFDALGRLGVRAYFGGGYRNTRACELAAGLGDADLLLLTGPEAGPLKRSTAELVACFPEGSKVQAETELPTTGLTSASATPEQGEAYDRRVVEFFRETLRPTR